MKIFQPGEKYELIFSAYPRAGSVAGSVEILSVDRVPESEMQFLECGSKESFYAHCGEISFIIHSKSATSHFKTHPSAYSAGESRGNPSSRLSRSACAFREK